MGAGNIRRNAAPRSSSLVHPLGPVVHDDHARFRRYPWRWFFLYDTIGVVLWALLAVLIGYAGGWYFSDYPLLGVIVGIAVGGLVGVAIQRLQARWAGRR